jgi:outer membrane protein assembly factor BamD
VRSAALVLVVALTACSKGSGGGSTPASYSDDAQAAYEAALHDMRRGNCLEADPAFDRVRREFPYSRFAALAELRAADCKFQEKAYPEAIQAYRQFVRYRPSHEEIPYARFRIAQANFKQIPSEWLLSPPNYERDLGATQDALRQIRRFILDFPDDERIPEAQRMMTQVLRILAEHELYAARFYMRRDAWRGVVMRLETLLRSYEGSGLEPEALLLLGEANEHLRRGDAAREAYQELVRRFPQSEQAADARERMR